MAKADTRRALANRRRSDRDRKRRQRAGEKAAAQPDQRAVDHAFVVAVQRTIATAGGPTKVPKAVDDLVKAAWKVLGDSGYDTKSKRATVLFARALGA